MHEIFKQWYTYLLPVTIKDELDSKGKKQVEKFAWTTGQKLNKNSVALMTGSKTVNVIDVDTKDLNKLEEPFKSWCDDRLMFSDTLIVETKSGYHFYFYSDKKIKTSTKISPFVDVRGEGGVIFVHSDSKVAHYEVVCDEQPTKCLNELENIIPKPVEREHSGKGYSTLDDLERAVHLDERPSREKMEDWLSKINANCDYQTWSDVLRALNSWDLDGEEGLELAITWSQSSDAHELSDDEIAEKYHQNVADVPSFYKKIVGIANRKDLTQFEVKILSLESESDFEALAEEISESTLNNKQREDLAEKLATKEVELGLSSRKRGVHWKKQLSRKQEKYSSKNVVNFPDVIHTQNGAKVMNTLANLLYFIEHHSELEFKYDVILQTPVINNSYSAAIIGQNTIAYSKLFDELTRAGVNASTMLSTHYNAMLFNRTENGLLNYIESLDEWDGVTDYISQVADTLETVVATKEYVRNVIKNFVIQAIAAWDNKERTPHKLSKLESVLVFVGSQGIGKTTWVANLMPRFMGNYFKEGVEINPHDKDSYMEATRAGLVELGELDSTTRKADIGSLKSFLGKDTDEYRAPYAQSSEKYVRRAVFFGTVNNPDFLKDSTGSRRFVALDVKKLKLPSEDIVLKMWAQAKTLYLNGEDWKMRDEEMVYEHKSLNERFTDIGNIGDIVESLVKALEIAKEPKVQMSVRKLLKGLGESKLNSRERSDFISLMDVKGYSRDSRGNYYLPSDVVRICNGYLHDNSADFEEL